MGILEMLYLPSTGPTWLAGCVLSATLVLSASSAHLLRFLLAMAADMGIVDERQFCGEETLVGEMKSAAGAYRLSVLWIRTTTSGTDSASDSCFPLFLCWVSLSAALKLLQNSSALL